MATVLLIHYFSHIHNLHKSFTLYFIHRRKS